MIISAYRRSIITTLIRMLSQVLTLAVLARGLSVTEYADGIFILTITGAFILLAEFGQTSLELTGAKGTDQRIYVLVLSSVLGIFAYIIFNYFYINFFTVQTQFSVTLFISVLHIPISIIVLVLRSQFEKRLQLNLVAGLDLIISPIAPVIAWTLCQNELSLLTVPLTYGLTELARAVLYWCFIRNISMGSLNIPVIKKYIRDGIYLLASNICHYLLLNLDVILVALLAPKQEASIYIVSRIFLNQQ